MNKQTFIFADVSSLFGGAAIAEWKGIGTHPFFKGAMDRSPKLFCI
jgi:hypothetical protein